MLVTLVAWPHPCQSFFVFLSNARGSTARLSWFKAGITIVVGWDTWNQAITIVRSHTIVPAHNKQDAAWWFAQIFGLNFEGDGDHFVPVRMNGTLKLLFVDAASFSSHHCAF